jgi:hypothetical protein
MTSVFGQCGEDGLYSDESLLCNKESLSVELKKKLEKLRIFPDIDILMVLGTVRSGTTALQLVLSQLPEVRVSEFQPFKAMMRHGPGMASCFGFKGPRDIDRDDIILLKETLGPYHEDECALDPIGVLLGAGISLDRIKAVFIVRDPRKVFHSTTKLIEVPLRIQLTRLLLAQMTVIRLYERYREYLGCALPLYYEALDGREEELILDMIRRLGLELNGSSLLDFCGDTLGPKVRWNEAEEKHYWDNVIQPMLDRRRFSYCNGEIPEISEEAKRFIMARSLPMFSSWKDMVEGFWSDS